MNHNNSGNSAARLEEAKASLGTTRDLATRMKARAESQEGDHRGKVTLFVGAGASMQSGLPNGGKLKSLLLEKFTGENDGLIEYLNLEAKEYFGDQTLDSLTLFEIAGLLSLSVLGRNRIQKEVTAALSEVESRSIGIELMAHLAKHRFVDNVVCMNFDNLLDDAFLDELPDRASIIVSERNVPLKAKRDRCYLVKPFGTLGRAGYNLSIDEVKQYGPAPIRAFISKYILAPVDSANNVIVLVGYRGAEKAFDNLVSNHTDGLDIFVIDPDKSLSLEIRNRFPKRANISIHSISLDTDDAFELLAQVLGSDLQPVESAAWVPVARHRLVSIVPYKHLLAEKDDNTLSKRFVLELVLQAVKSRGFVHLESFSRVSRLKRHGHGEVAALIGNLVDQQVLKPDKWLSISDNPDTVEPFVPNYGIAMSKQELAMWFLQYFEIEAVKNSSLELSGNNIEIRDQPVLDYVIGQFSEIEKAPDIEISEEASPGGAWSLGSHGEVLRSTKELFTKTGSSLEKLRREGGHLRGIWSTGEWLFHKDGWAEPWGASLQGDDNIDIKAIITDRGGIQMMKSERRDQVIANLNDAKNVEIKYLDWWELNRILTIFGPNDSQKGAIYFRRRLNQPIVQPYWIPFNDNDSSTRHDSEAYVEELWNIYWTRARKGPLEG